MEEHLFSTINSDSTKDDIRTIIPKLDLKKLLKLIRREAVHHSEKVILIIQVIFQNIESLAAQTTNPHFNTYEFCLSILQQIEIPSKAVSELVGILLLETDKLSSENLAQLAGTVLESIKDGDMFDKWIIIFPKILSTLSSQPTVVHGQDSFSGKEFKNHLINTLLNARWQPSSSIPLVTVLRDIALEPDELDRAIKKVFTILPELEINELPPLFFQLLQLCAKGQRSQVLKGIITFFNTKNSHLEGIADTDLFQNGNVGEQENFDTVKTIEGTVILHISFAAKQDQDLGKEFIKILKENKFNSDFILSPFCLALALAIAKIQGLEDQIFDIIKTGIGRSFKEQENKQKYLWIRQLFVSESNAYTKVISTVHYSTFGWDHITGSVVSLGLNLVESSCSKNNRDAFLSEEICRLGQDLLIETFKVHDVIRPNILEQILDRVICRDIVSVVNYTGVLSAMVEHSPHVFLGCISKVQEVLYCLPFLSHATASGLLQALMPLLKVSLSLRDALMFTLRKGMFNREVEARKVAISGHLLILKSFKVLGGAAAFSQSQSSQNSTVSLTQVLMDVHIAKHNKGANEALCLELLSTLQKTLTHQAEARKLLYQSIHHVMRKNPSVSGAVLDLLLNQFQKYYEWSEDMSPPLKLQLCVQIKMDEPVLMEPLSALLHAIQLCLYLAEFKSAQDEFINEELETPLSAFKKLKSVMKMLVRRMIETDLEDFEMDKSSDFSNSCVGQKNQLYAEQLLGSYEALMEYCYRRGETPSESNCKDLLSLFHKYQILHDISRSKTGVEKKADKEKKNESKAEEGKKDKLKNQKDKLKKTKPIVSVLSLEVLSKILGNLYCNPSIDNVESFDLLRSEESFVNYLINIVSQTVVAYNEKIKSLQHDTEKNAIYFGLIARALVKLYKSEKDQTAQHGNESQADVRSSNKHVKRQQNITSSVDSLAKLFTLFCKWNPKLLHTFLVALSTGQTCLGVKSTSRPLQDLLRTVIKKFQNLVFLVLSEADDQYLKDVIPLLTIIEVLSEHSTDGFHEELYKWITQLCQQQNIDDFHVGRALLSLSFDLCHQNKTNVTYYEEIAQAIHKVLGDIEEDVIVQCEKTFGVVSQNTAVNVGILLVQQLDGVITQCSWVLDQLKGDTSNNSGTETTKRIEKEICIRIGHWVNACQAILQTGWPQSSLILSILKMFSRLFNFLAAFCKYELSLYNSKAGHMSSYFEKLVKLCATHLTPKVYSFITYIEAVEREKGKTEKNKAGGSKLKGDHKTVPHLIGAIEEYERCLVTLSKKSKVNLTDHLKRSTARDFRINAEVVQNALKNNDVLEDENTTQNGSHISNSHQGENEDEPLSNSERQSSHQVPTSKKHPTAKRGRTQSGSNNRSKLRRH